MARLAKIVRAIFTWAEFHWAGLYRRDPRLWVFGARHAFAGNSHYLFLWVAHQEPDIEAVWIATDRSTADRIRRAGLRAEVKGTRSALRVIRRAGVFFYNDRVSEIGAAASNGAVLVNLWHGSGLKNIASLHKKSVLYDLGKGRLSGLRVKYERIEHPARAIFVSTSPAIAARFSEAFDVPLSDCPIIGTPRLDPAVDKQMRAWSKEFGAYAEFESARKHNREIYIYMPTYRPGHREFLGAALPDPERLSEILRARSAVMFVKLHPQDQSRHSLPDNASAGPDPRILSWAPDMLFYNVIDQIDCLITDYSSVMFDFIAVKSAGLLLYPFDIDRYLDERGFYFPYEENVAGHRADTFSDLCDAISTGRAVAEIELSKLDRVRKRVWEGSKLPASRGVTDEIRQRAGLPGRSEGRAIAHATGLVA